MFPYDSIVGNSLLATGTVLAAYIARRTRRSGKKIDELANGLLDDKIYRAVKDVLADQAGDEIRMLLDAILHHAREGQE